MPEKSDFIFIGTLGRIKGLKGEIKLHLTKGRFILPDEIPTLYLSERGNYIPYQVKSFNSGVKDTLVQFLNFDNATDIQKLVGKEVFLQDTDLAEPEFSMLDLAGYMASDIHLGTIGKIERVDTYPQQFLAAINFGITPILVPLNDKMVLNIDVVNKTVLMELPDGLIDVFTSQV